MKKYVTGLALLALTATYGADYQFPSSAVPGGKSPADVEQYICFIWDDNGYSGEIGTQYETAPGSKYANSSFVGGRWPDGRDGAKNEFNLEEGMIGMSWAAKTLAGIPVLPDKWEPRPDAANSYPPNSEVLHNGKIYTTGSKWATTEEPGTSTESWFPWTFVKDADTALLKKNDDGSQVAFSFNVISGLFIPVFGPGWQNYESKLGYFEPNPELDYPDGTNPADKHSKIAVSWGREMLATSEEGGGTIWQHSAITKSFKKAIDAGHEIGNHTIDHMESNSPLPNNDKGFGRWDGEGFDNTLLDTMPWGEVVDEAESFGQKPGASAQTMGWKVMAGRYLSEKAWAGAITISEEELDLALDVSIEKGNLFGFRAPRLEVSSGLYYALNDLGYQYDCGLEEGYEQNIDGSNFLWPYTTDNGSPNVTYQRLLGERVSIDSMPGGLWMIPSNVFLVPEEDRRRTYDNHKLINAAAPDGGELESFEDWAASGAKITGYDFNLWILWGMDSTAWINTMKHNTTLRLNGNKAPLHYGAHTDYYTPIYDNGVLLGEFNKSSYGLNVTNGWNTWKTRINATTEYVDWALENKCNFITGHDLIEKIKKLQQGEVVGDQGKISTANWNFFKNDPIGSTTDKESHVDDIVGAKVTVKKAQGEEYPDCGFALYEDEGFFKGMTHISLDYQITTPISIRIAIADAPTQEVVLGNIGPMARSGKIPLSAFVHSQYEENPGDEVINTEKIIGLEVKILTDAKTDQDETITLKNLRLYGAAGAEKTAIIDAGSLVNKGVTKINALSANELKLSVAERGVYSVDVVAMNGRVVSSVSNIALDAGVNAIPVNNLSTGMYLIQISGDAGKVSMKSVLR